MSDKKVVAVFSSVLLLTLATGTAWANATMVSTARIAPGHPSAIMLTEGAASGAMRTYVIARQNNARANQDVLVATLEIKLLSQNPEAWSTRNLSVVSPVQPRASTFSANNHGAYSTFARTGAFGGEEEKVTTRRPEGQVPTGVFWTPQGFSGRGQDYRPSNALKSGFFGIQSGPGLGDGTGERRGDQGYRLRKPRSKSAIWRGL
jgi:hypothetical protein